MNRGIFGALALVLSLQVTLGSAPASAESCKPYCDDTTIRTANQLDGKGHLGWLATTLDTHGYSGKRWAEETLIPKGHGKRWVGVIHVPKAKTSRARKALLGHWFARRGNIFVLPLVTSTNTEGGSGANFEKAARWAAQKLGEGWTVVEP